MSVNYRKLKHYNINNDINNNINYDINYNYYCEVRDKDNINLISNKYNVNVEPDIKINKP